MTSIIVYCPFEKNRKIGVGNREFVLNLSNNKFLLNDRIESEEGVSCIVLSKGIRLSKEHFVYTVSLWKAKSSDYCPLTQLQKGSIWEVKERLFPN